MALRIVKHSGFWFSLSGALCLLSVAAIFIWGLNLSIDFTGGTLMHITTEKEADVTQIKQLILEGEQEVNAMIAAGEGTLPETTDTSLAERLGSEEESAITLPTQAVELGDPVIIPGSDGISIKMRATDEYTHQIILGKLRSEYPDLEENKFETIGPVVGATLRNNAIIALFLALVAIILYVGFAFRKVPKRVQPWKFGVVAVIALFHDLLITVGVFAALGYFMNVEIDILFVTALLTILGYSVNDTIVVFDRFRENLKHQKRGQHLDQTADISLWQTMARSINTSLTLLLVLVALFILGDVTIKWFVFALIIGTIVGTYSSIFLASPLLVAWSRHHKGKH